MRYTIAIPCESNTLNDNLQISAYGPICCLNVDATRLRGNNTFSMLNSAEHEILNAHKYKNNKNFSFV